ncbi:E3 ubiquitin-protein ligase RNF19B-like isoform X2 [Pyrgilauda ruficollis]|uniref:E3 ubiquitin-protein ligase RNF19B-like isoform X2 n=1 Tax=Pyrgilauda ruficollis TaxID=221976 RepID=UPI001B8626DD|nr:E3 ubiquitin-protein ligase RNF19B-like isoform X2 [Pyrgilauda ruficollis]
MEQPARVPGPRRLLGCFRRKPRALGGETPPEPEPEPEQPEETRVVLALGEGPALEECPLCLLPQPPEAFPSLASCSHRSCRACLQQYLCLAVRESRVPVSCPHCPAALQPHDVHRLLPEPALRDKYEEFLLRRLLVADPGTRWCPAPDCSYAVFAHGCAECPRLTCGREGCGTEFCYHCRQPWHPDGPCAPVPPTPSLATPTAQPEELAHAEAEDIKVCPRCSAFIMKINDGSCNRMNCTVCGCLFCWLCLQEISDVHFLSPSGCTFWGKRPWSRTRRILWQLGMVLGAPMVISLAAGVAVPVITIGIPIYMGAGPEPAKQPLRVPAVPLCHQQCPPVSLCVPYHNSSHCGCWRAPGAHLRVRDRGAVAVPQPLALQGRPRARGPRRGGAGQPGQAWVPHSWQAWPVPSLLQQGAGRGNGVLSLSPQ